MDLKKVGVLLRDEEQTYPLSELDDLFARRGISLAPLQWHETPPGDLDMVMAMGGDGTVLKALDLFSAGPVLAINFGTTGFLTAADRDDLDKVLTQLLEGNYLVSERLVLECRHPHGVTRSINEVIVRLAGSGFLYIDVSVDGTKIRTIKGDGVVVGTPTGSTGFLLSAGAPIVMPDVRCLMLDGINEHNFTSRSLILSPDCRIELHVGEETREHGVHIAADGRPLGSLSPGDDVQIVQSSTTAKLIYFQDSYFFNNLSSKLGW
jgi:NAD+ kinase